MPRVDFRSLPDHGRLWVFPSSRTLQVEESSGVLKEVDRFLEQWTAHGSELKSGRDLREGRFLLIGVDEAAKAASGCSIDALVKSLRALGAELAFRLSTTLRSGTGMATKSKLSHEQNSREWLGQVKCLVRL